MGDGGAGDAWVAWQDVGRLGAIRVLKDGLSRLMGEMVPGLWTEKAHQLRSDTGTAEWREATARLRDLGRHLMVSLEAAFEERADRLQALGFPIGPCLHLFDELIDHW